MGSHNSDDEHYHSSCSDNASLGLDADLNFDSFSGDDTPLAGSSGLTPYIPAVSRTEITPYSSSPASHAPVRAGPSHPRPLKRRLATFHSSAACPPPSPPSSAPSSSASPTPSPPISPIQHLPSGRFPLWHPSLSPPALPSQKKTH